MREARMEELSRAIDEARDKQARHASLALRAYGQGNFEEGQEQFQLEQAAFLRVLELSRERLELCKPPAVWTVLDIGTVALGIAAVLIDVWCSKAAYLEGDWVGFTLWTAASVYLIWLLSRNLKTLFQGAKLWGEYVAVKAATDRRIEEEKKKQCQKS